MKTIHHVVEIEAPAERVFEALTTQRGLSGWWSTDVSSGEPRVGEIVHFRFVPDEFNPDMEVTELEGGSVLGWKCVGGHGPWADNTFRFELAEGERKQTKLRFWQQYAVELPDDAYGTYNYNWAYYLESLRLLCEEGSGKPFAA